MIPELLFVLLGFFAPTDAPPTERPRIGLALSGGSALGSAHVGVLKQLEAMRIPVDYVAGTSMGSIIGGLYASGMSPDEIEQELTTVDWDAIFTDDLPREQKFYRAKLDDAVIPSDFEVGVGKDGLKLPSGIIMGRNLIFTLRRMLSHVMNVRDFDQLPIPYRALGTDLVTGELVVMGEGDLAKAIRASMSIPAAFSPVNYDGRLLVDGGMVQNLPVQTLREMGADIIIAVNVAAAYAEVEDLQSFEKVTSQVITLAIRANVNESAEDADVMINPDLAEFSGTQFERAGAMIPKGEEAALSVAEQLRQYSLSEADYAVFRATYSKPDWRPVITQIGVDKNIETDPRGILKEIRVKIGEPLDLDLLQQSLDGIYRLGYYENVDYAIEEIAPGEHQLIIKADQKSWGPNYLRAGLELEADFSGNSEFNFKTILTTKPLNSRDGEIKATVFIGETPSIDVAWFQPLSYRRTWFVRPSVQVEKLEATIFSESPQPALADLESWGASLAVGRLLGNYGTVGLSINQTGGDLEIQTGEIITGGESLGDFSIDTGTVELDLALDQLNNISYPLRGWGAFMNLTLGREDLNAPFDYETLSVSVQKAFPITSHSSIFSVINANTSLGSQPPPQDRFFLGGFFQLSGLPTNSLGGLYGGNFSNAYIHRLVGRDGTLKNIYVGGTLEAGNLWQTSDDVSLSDLQYSSSVLLGLDTAFGPINLAYGVTEDGDGTWYFIAGRNFD